MHVRFLALGLAVLGIGVTVASCRQHRHDPEKMHKFVTWVVDDALDDINATDVQREAVHQSKDRIFAEMKKVRADNKADHQAMLAEWNKESPDAAMVHALIDARIEAMRIVAHQAANEVLAVHGVLTPEQRAQLSEKMREHMDDMEK
ncbi:MAG: hypothetical protein A2289_10515 [Deltaproteobacteria bacterium RIFOXYA12_FULL_58_15]|nr:MAG: hypothetical protein A2289_10515 [Deltaproteobacteria bacterium RIFOXYA12_FULL_58_15]